MRSKCLLLELDQNIHLLYKLLFLNAIKPNAALIATPESVFLLKSSGCHISPLSLSLALKYRLKKLKDS
ncbi:hypothetical protein VIBNISFn27_970066 [Vibrio nigripulchritudo SFn27]|uniref:Uncharacterized protein n=1 Tax=Vibrio nigripulchritudo TaxID=28173 RepID=U4KD12_9VIBR|nr:hypothetical protein VIBNIBLFn1_240065 [Vibrio nigripulchritudo BLFn1]CCN91608.1 hypothetical protein VIBNISFn27_970066 [Vibrio nigripulchritudo SFn27]CCN96492.1 hypothetical protein VIBNIENn2_780065 [Vibrio nigripulchritudo ENn2]CCO38366.1 hypothetical protein VIBNISFn135_100067 [Vibrio nigripulchritudo SFn135]CCO53822.1 hypothetical protein VIBNIWn13_600066 [Vibrio nigripulchritudo Wn13]CCO60906.1 hypothetical protein VIBNI_B1139 [Vibrio nigripulchritudo]